MKKKIGTIIDDEILTRAKRRAAVEKRPFSGVLEDALAGYLERSGAHGSPSRSEALRAVAKFASHGGLLPLDEIGEILAEDTLET